jgi:hypothetical protein
LSQSGDAHVFIDEAYKHAKPIAAVGQGMELLTVAQVGQLVGGAAPSPTSGQGRGSLPADAHTPSAVEGASAEVQNLAEVGRVLNVTGANARQLAAHGIIVGQDGSAHTVIQQFLAAVAHHRFWGRPRLGQVSA